MYVGETERGGVNVRGGGMEGDAQQPYYRRSPWMCTYPSVKLLFMKLRCRMFVAALKSFF